MAHQVTTNKTELTIRLPLGDGMLAGNLTLPESAQAIVLFAQGSGSSRLSPHNRFVAEALHQAGLATLLMDLLTRQEERADMATAHLRFDIPRLAARLLRATDWLAENPATYDLPIGYFGASTGAAAALVAAAGRPAIGAVVSRGGRPDLAGRALVDVRAAVLLIVGGQEGPVIDLNEEAYGQLLRAHEKNLHIVPRATHLFQEPDALDEAANLASDWFSRHLGGSPR